MSNELSLTTAFTYSKNGVNLADAVTGLAQTVSGNGSIENVLALSTSAAALTLGGLSAPFGWGWFKNLDASIVIHLMTSTAGTIFASLPAGAGILLPLGTGLSAPAAKSASGTPLLYYRLFPP